VSEPQRSRRKYDSRRRQEQAALTRRTILDAAQRLFEQDGYVITTVEAIADEAGVALKTVYSAFGTKSGILRALWDLLLKGDLDAAPVADRSWYREMLDEPDSEQLLRRNAGNARAVKTRIGPLLRVIRSASAVDSDGAALWRLIQSDFYENQRAVVRVLSDRGALRQGLDQTKATDLLWTLNHPDVWLLLVGERGWTPDQFEAWFAEVTCHELLAGRSSRPSWPPDGGAGFGTVMGEQTGPPRG
jgi:AcrR family transcriptional regulator